MVLVPFVISFLLALTNVLAQGTDIAQLAALYPNCSVCQRDSWLSLSLTCEQLTCMTELIPQSSCMTESGLNQTCLCTNVALNDQIGLCASQGCTVKELLTTKNASSTVCGAEIRDHSADMTIIGLSCGAVAVVIFTIRIIFRLLMHQRKLFWDDWTMLLTVALAIPPTILAPLLADNGLGKDIWTLPFGNISNVLEYFFVGELCYLVGLAINKISILCFFLRIFPAKRLQLMIFITMGACAAYGIAFFFATLFQCTPINYMWQQWDNEHEGWCNDFHLQGWLAAAFNIVLDLIVLALPLGELFKMNMSRRKKFGVMLMFLTGLL